MGQAYNAWPIRFDLNDRQMSLFLTSFDLCGHPVKDLLYVGVAVAVVIAVGVVSGIKGTGVFCVRRKSPDGKLAVDD